MKNNKKHMKKITYILPILLSLYSCKNDTSPKKEESTTTPEKKALEDIVEQHIEADLQISPSENYKFKIYKAHLDSDDKLDAIITVNRLEFAVKKASKMKNPSIQKEANYTGHYNYIFFYDGGLDKISPSVLVPSSPMAELKVEFQNVTSAVYKDILIDYYLTTTCFRDYFTIRNHSLNLVFQWERFNVLDKTKPLVHYFGHDEGSVGLAKDILIYEGEITNLSEMKSIYTFKPNVVKNGKLLHRFFYFENEGKYFTKK
jgi:hypothetical protein